MNKHDSTNFRFSLVVVISVVLHAVLLMSFDSTQPRQSISVNSQLASINIRLSQPVTSRTKVKHRDENTSKKQPFSPVAKALGTTEEISTRDHIAEDAMPVQQQVSQATREQVISRVRNEMHSHFFYPKLAQKRNWQGTVRLSFRLDTRGTINEIKIVESSGHRILDDAAIQALSQVRKIHHQHENLGSDAPFELTVIYRLRDTYNG